jgi:four helix bundle protein
MGKPYDLRERSFLFALDVVTFCRIVADRGFILRRLAGQLVDAAGSVGADLEESVGGQTKPDFVTKQFIALKEARETRYWLRLIAKSEPALRARAAPLIQQASEFVAILTTSVKTARSNENRGVKAV